MKTKTILFVLFLILFVQNQFSLDLDKRKIVPIPELIKPDLLIVDGKRLIIRQKMVVSVYSLKDFKLICSFGKKGEGPKEFKPYQFVESGINISILKNQIIVGSNKKLTFFSKNGKFIYEKKLNDAMAFNWRLLENGFVAMTYLTEGNIPYFSFSLYDINGEKIKNLINRMIPHYKQDNMVLWSKLAYKSVSSFQLIGKKIYIPSGDKFAITVFDSMGKQEKIIKTNYKKLIVTDRDRQRIIEAWKESPYIKKNWSSLKKVIKIPNVFPAINSIHVDGNKLFVQTFKLEKGKTEFFIFDQFGNQIQQIFLLIKYRNIIDTFPYTISAGKLYQLVENEDKEEWELQIEDIKF